MYILTIINMYYSTQINGSQTIIYKHSFKLIFNISGIIATTIATVATVATVATAATIHNNITISRCNFFRSLLSFIVFHFFKLRSDCFVFTFHMQFTRSSTIPLVRSFILQSSFSNFFFCFMQMFCSTCSNCSWTITGSTTSTFNKWNLSCCSRRDYVLIVTTTISSTAATTSIVLITIITTIATIATMTTVR